MKLKGKIAIVVGGSRDIGRVVSQQLARQGAKVVVNYCNSEPQALETKKLIEDEGGDCMLVRGDLTKWEDARQLVEATVKQHGPKIDILVNVAGGLMARKLIEEQDEEFYNLLMDVNLKTVFFATKATVAHMEKGASIINFSSQAGRDGGGMGASLYATAKGAVMTYTRSMAKEFGPRGIRVNAVSPGMIATSFHDRFTHADVRTNVANATPLRRQGEACEVASLVAYLASDESSFITGTNIDINGGTWFS